MSEKMPTRVNPRVGPFDRFATLAAEMTGKAWFFAFCCMTIVVWAPSYPLFGDIDTWQLPINTFTTVVTFLLVALIQNTQNRDVKALHQTLNAQSRANLALMQGMEPLIRQAGTSSPIQTASYRRAMEELRQSIGVEHRESS